MYVMSPGSAYFPPQVYLGLLIRMLSDQRVELVTAFHFCTLIYETVANSIYSVWLINPSRTKFHLNNI
jgi:hypothetical protein